jgi:dienelactone hydrolase
MAGEAHAAPSFRATLLGLLGDADMATPSCPPALEVHEFVSLTVGADAGIVRQRVSYCVQPGERVMAYLLLPAGAPVSDGTAAAAAAVTADTPPRRYPAIFAHHQHNDEFHLGKSEVVGLAGNQQQAYGLELARRGYIVLAPDALCFEERGPYACASGTAAAQQYAPPADGQRAGWAAERHEANAALVRGTCLQTKYSRDAMRGVDVLAAHPLVDPARIGAIGHSLGGQQTLFLAALDPRIRAAVSSCGFSSVGAIIRERINHNAAAYVPGLLRHGDLGDVLACVAPRPFLALNGAADPIFPTDGVVATVATAAAAYEKAGAAGDCLRLRLFEGQGHAFPDAMREEACEWLRRWLDV